MWLRYFIFAFQILEPRDSFERQPEVWCYNRTSSLQQQEQQTISSSDAMIDFINELNVDFPFNDKMTSPSTQGNGDFSYADEFLKNAFPTAFTTSDLDFVDILNVEQSTAFSDGVDSPNLRASSGTSQTALFSTTSNGVANATTFHRSSSKTALSLGTFWTKRRSELCTMIIRCWEPATSSPTIDVGNFYTELCQRIFGNFLLWTTTLGTADNDHVGNLK